jgi:methyltransferase
MSALYALLAFIIVQRLSELAYARRNTRRLLARGAIEYAAGHYPLFVLLHGGWLAAMLIFIDSAAPANMPLLTLYIALQAVRLWVIVTLGERWTTRIIVPPGEPGVAHGPYRYMKHPNYAVVVAEIATAPLIFGAWEVALVFSLLNLALLSHRIARENEALPQETDL